MNKATKILIAIVSLFTLCLITSCSKKYTLEYYANGGTFKNGENSIVEEYKAKTEVKLMKEKPTRAGYDFVGWENVDNNEIVTGSIKITKHIILQAKWEKSDKPDPNTKYTVTYDAKDGIFADGTHTKTEEYTGNSLVTLNKEIPVVPGQEFVGWYNQETDELVDSNFTITKNITLVAKYGEPMFTIEYKAMSGSFKDGTNNRVIKVKMGSTFDYGEIPTYGERLFNGWYNSETDEFVEPGSLITSDMQVKAKYRRPGDEYSVTYNVNGGILEVSEVVPYYEGIYFILTVPTKEGFEFEGWYESPDFTGEKVVYQTDQTTGNKVYYAKWKLVDSNYVTTIFNELVPETTTTNLNFPREYQGAQVYYKSSNTKVLATTGVINPTHKTEVVTVDLELYLDGVKYTFQRDVTVKAIVFEEMQNPVAGYFQTTHLVNLTDTMAENLDIAYYAFAHVSASGGVTVNQAAQLTKMMQQAVELRKEKSMRFVLSIAGGAENFAKACANGGYAKVAVNIVNIVKEYNMDGVDIDWEFPTTASETLDMVLLCRAVKTRLQALEDGTGTPYLLTSAIPSHESYQKFNLSDLNEVLDYFNMMSYDMNLEGRATHLCPLHKSKYDGNKFGVSLGVEWFEKAGVSREKIIIGAAFYGKSYTVTGKEGSWEAMGYPGIGQGAQLTTLQYSSGTVTYKWLVQNGIFDDKANKRYFDPIAKVPYIYNSETKLFITYEDPESLIAKVDYAYENGFGIMFWEYGYDYQNELTDAICNRMAEYRNQ